MDEIALDENSYENNVVDTTDETIRTTDADKPDDNHTNNRAS